jgi:hypothetical protein
MQHPLLASSTISGVNRLDDDEKQRIYNLLIPAEIMQRFGIAPDFRDAQGRKLLDLRCEAGSSSTEMSLYHRYGFPDPVLYGHITGTLNGLVHVLLYVLNDPESPRFDVDRLPDGTPTRFGTEHRNLEAEEAAMLFGLAPGQVRRGPRLLGSAVQAFDDFVTSLGHDLYFAEPLYYHNAILFERYGFSYEKGRRLMQSVQEGFMPGGDLRLRLDGSTAFRQPQAANSIRLRSWALHDGLMGERFQGVTMYKRTGKSAGLDICPGCDW